LSGYNAETHQNWPGLQALCISVGVTGKVKVSLKVAVIFKIFEKVL